MTDDASERWLPVLGYEGLYEVSDRGQVVRKRSGKTLKWQAGRDGYPEVTLSRAGVQKAFKVHVLVLGAFVGPRPPGQEARHGPAGKADPGLANLRGWGTRSENLLDRVEDGQGNRGERHGNAKVTTAMVLEVRARVAAGERQIDVAADMGIERGNVWAIVHRKSWQHI